ncbi:PQQ-dependent sugar dehydrogenase [Qipengyuania psychrotolerans]|uniref:PQQ-dependent sugar dehydrogenase n=1 Tax=Qipengyuania psychrotolerans TaxID=2867238 RepID=A0ABX8ZJM8_9SPHN|nr:PQQ-dependent sugar dehydrogenase [Qipengyuania psychrotolerans]QZD87727.1 PQQ-dependent sugar dehydrogenase [Qipengyuania psychrotolerans]
MKRLSKLAATLSPVALLASCGSGYSTEGGSEAVSTPAPTELDFAITEHGSFNEPWASAFLPGTRMLFITEKSGSIKFKDLASGRLGTVSGVPAVDYGGQGGLGDIAFLPSEAGRDSSDRTIYLSWVEAGEDDTRGAVVGRGQLLCLQADECSIEGLKVIWRQAPKVTGRGHYSHRIIFSPDQQYMYVTSGDRQKMQPAQDASNTLGTIVRLNLDGTPSAGNPLAAQGSPSDQIWSWGHRNLLGIDFDASGQLWEIEHGPAGGDELNLVKKGANYGWPVRSDGDHYDGANIPDHTADDGFEKFAINWTPVIAPGNMVFYRGDLFDGMKGDLLISGLKTKALIRVEVDGEDAREVARYDMDNRIRSVIEGPDGALWVLEDGEGGRLLELRPE